MSKSHRKFAKQTQIVYGCQMVSVVCIHGLGCSPRSFDQFENCLWKLNLGINMVAKIQLPRRADCVDHLNFAALAEDISVSLGKDERYVVVGHSMGGAIAIKLAGILKSKAEALVLLEGNLLEDDCGDLSGTISKYPCGNYPDDFYDGIKALSGAGWRYWEVDHLQYDADTLCEYAKLLVQASSKTELFADFQALNCKKQLFYGDDYLGNDYSPNRRAIELLRDFELYHISGAGHFLMQDEPLACAQNAIQLAGLVSR